MHDCSAHVELLHMLTDIILFGHVNQPRNLLFYSFSLYLGVQEATKYRMCYIIYRITRNFGGRKYS